MDSPCDGELTIFSNENLTLFFVRSFEKFVLEGVERPTKGMGSGFTPDDFGYEGVIETDRSSVTLFLNLTRAKNLERKILLM